MLQLSKTVHDLRRQYAGSVPLGRQERAAEEARRLAAEKGRAAAALREAEEKAAEAEERAQEVAAKQEGEKDRNALRTMMLQQKKNNIWNPVPAVRKWPE